MKPSNPNPFNYGPPVPPNKFVGYQSLVQKIVHNIVTGGISYALIGGRRCGKSSCLKHIEYLLVKTLNQGQQVEEYVMPLYLDFKNLLYRDSEDGVFGFILYKLYKVFTSSRTQRVMGLKSAFSLDLSATHLQAFITTQKHRCMPIEFKEIIEDFLDVFEPGLFSSKRDNYN